jgi:hypothetical protein
MTIKPEDVQHNAFLDNLKTDWVAINEAGVPIGRASDKESLERASPASAAQFTGSDFEPKAKAAKAEAKADEPIKVDVKAEAEKAEADEPAKAQATADETFKSNRQRKPA